MDDKTFSYATQLLPGAVLSNSMQQADLSFHIQEGNFDQVRELISQGASVNNDKIPGFRSRPLNMAIEWGQYTIAEFLLKNGAKPALRDHTGRTAHDLAASSRNPEFKNLLDRYRPRNNTVSEAPSDPSQTNRPPYPAP